MYVGAAEEFNELGVIAIMQESMRHVLIFSVINDPQASLEFYFLFEKIRKRKYESKNGSSVFHRTENFKAPDRQL